MWKVFAGFIVFALLALFVIMKGGDKVDMQGEAAGHNPTEVPAAHDTPAAPTAPAAPVTPAAPATPAAPEASK